MSDEEIPTTKIYSDCKKCEGKGTVTYEVHVEGIGFTDLDYECSDCSGEGWIEVEVCAACLEDEKGCKCYDEEEDDLSEAERLGEVVLR